MYMPEWYITVIWVIGALSVITPAFLGLIKLIVDLWQASLPESDGGKKITIAELEQLKNNLNVLSKLVMRVAGYFGYIILIPEIPNAAVAE